METDEAISDRVGKMTDDELFDELKKVVNDSRFRGGHDRRMAKVVGAECLKRGWPLRVGGG